MGIQKDAGEILVFLYKKYIENPYSISGMTLSQLSREMKWNDGRIIRAIDYLSDKKMLDIDRLIGTGFIIDKIHSDGIDIIENENKFVAEFGVSVGFFSVKFKPKK